MSNVTYLDEAGSTPVGTLYDGVRFNGQELRVGDVVGWDDPDVGDERDGGKAIVSMRVVTGTVNRIFETASGPELTIEGGVGRIDLASIQYPAERFDRFMSSSATTCLIEEWLVAAPGAPEDYQPEEYVVTER